MAMKPNFQPRWLKKTIAAETSRPVKLLYRPSNAGKLWVRISTEGESGLIYFKMGTSEVVATTEDSSLAIGVAELFELDDHPYIALLSPSGEVEVYVSTGIAS